MNNDLKSKLEKSDSVASLRDEQMVAASLLKRGWSVNHGPFYLDISSKKFREVDVVARQIWTFAPTDSFKQTVRLNLFIEVKSINDYHLLFSPAKLTGSIGRLHNQYRIWPGNMDARHNWLKNPLINAGIPNDGIREMLSFFDMAAFPEGFSLMHDAEVGPPQIDPIASAFRETNIGGVKELDNSVFGKASLSLRSSLRSHKRSVISWHSSFISTTIDRGRENEQSSNRDIIEEIQNSILQQIRYLDQVHPIIIVKAGLWIVHQSSIRSLPWIRFVQLDLKGSPMDWVDVVNKESMDAYFDFINEHYEQIASKLGAKKETALSSSFQSE
jgi:hypothetical protein